ncbi:MAG: glycosyltransferase family 9 protein [Alphaproteobacteria bacterium]
MANQVRKNPLRHIHYGGSLLSREFLRGTSAQKRRFLSRITRRILHKFRLHNIHFFLFSLACYITVRDDQRYWLWGIRGLDNQNELKSWIKDREQPHILVMGWGSVGDVLQITPLLRALRQKMPKAKIVLLHRSPAASAVLAGNPNLDGIATADFHQFETLKHSVKVEGIADLVVEIPSMSFVVRYTRAPQDKRHPLFDEAMPETFFETAENVRTHWNAPRGYQNESGKFTWPEEWAHFQYLDVLGMTGNLPIHAQSHLDFYTKPSDDAILKDLPKGKRIITVQAGVDEDVANWARVTGQRPTKLLPLITWADAVWRLKEKNFALVQIGTLDDTPIEGVDLDLRGKTTLGEVAVILKNAYAHLGIEGGLVHLARAMQTKSVVVFGPTSHAFLGYPQNINLTVGDCNGCWGATKDWYIYCARGLREPECMNAYRAETLVNAVRELEATGQAKQASANS